MCCREALGAYPTSINEDLMLLRDAVTGSREELAIRVKPCVLHWLLLAVETLLKSHV